MNSLEPAHWVRAGVPLMEAIQGITQRSAELLDIDAGTLDADKLADLLIIDGIPLENIAVLQNRS